MAMESMVVPQLSIHLGNEQIPLSIEALASLLATYKTDQINSTAQESYQGVQEEPNLNITYKYQFSKSTKNGQTTVFSFPGAYY